MGFIHEWSRVTVGGRELWMSRDAVKDEDGRRINPTGLEALAIAEELGGRLPSPAELDARWAQAPIKNPVHPQRLWLAQGGRPADRPHDDGDLHSREVDRDVAEREGIVGNPGKCYTRRRDDGVFELYGAFIPAARVAPARWSPSGMAGDGNAVWPSASDETDAFVIQRARDSSHRGHHRDYMTVLLLTQGAAEPADGRSREERFDPRALPGTLGERCVAWLGHEWGRPGGVTELAGPRSNARITGYSQHCRRGGTFMTVDPDGAPRWDGGVPLPLPDDASHWCATTQSACLLGALRPGEEAPHGLRVSVRELWEDAVRRGTARPPSHRPQSGDLQILARKVHRDGSEALADPTRGDNGHVRRFIRATQDGQGLFFGGNEATRRAPQGELAYRERAIQDELLVGWIAYPRT